MFSNSSDNNKNTINYPLAYWQSEFNKLGFELDIDFPYCKEFVWDYVMPEAVRITIKAKDINTNYNQIIIPKTLAKKLLSDKFKVINLILLNFYT